MTNAGGIGVLGAAGMTPDELRSAIHWIRERVGSKPFGVDLLGHRDFVGQLMQENNIPQPRTRERRSGGIADAGLLRAARTSLEILFDEKVPIFVSGLGSPAFALEQAHAAGTRVWGLIGLPRQARREIEAGVDVVIAQGYDSGGHSGTIGAFTLVPEVVQMAEGTDTIVLAAGGVSSGRHLAAALAMGAAGIWTGTIWLATHESATEMFLKQRLIEAQAEDAVQSRATSGKPIRQLRSKWSDAWKQPGAPEPLQMPLQGMLVGDILAGIHEARQEDWMTTPAGQAVVGIHSIRPAAEVVYSLAEEAQDLLEKAAGVSAGD